MQRNQNHKLEMIYDEGSITVLPATHGKLYLGTFVYLERKGFGLDQNSLWMMFKREEPWAYAVKEATLRTS